MGVWHSMMVRDGKYEGMALYDCEGWKYEAMAQYDCEGWEVWGYGTV